MAIKNIDITPDQHKIVLDLLKQYLPNIEVWVYGSRIKGTARPQSDLDMIVFTSPAQTLAVSALKEAFDERNLPFRVDLFSWDQIPEEFHQNIKEQHVILSNYR